MSKIDELFNNILNKGNRRKLAVTNMSLTTTTGDKMEFPDLEEGKVPSVGDRATIDGSPAEGTVMYEDSDGNLWEYTFEGGELKEIKEKEKEDSEDVETLKQENEALREELAKMTSKASIHEEKAKDWDNLYSEIKNLKRKITSSNTPPDKSNFYNKEKKNDINASAYSSQAEKAEELARKRRGGL